MRSNNRALVRTFFYIYILLILWSDWRCDVQSSLVVEIVHFNLMIFIYVNSLAHLDI